MTDKLDSAKAPSKGALRAAKLIARSDKLRPLVNGYMLRETAAADFCEIIDRETKAPQMADLLRDIAETLDKLAPCPEHVLDQLAAKCERLLTELEGKL